LSEGDEIRATFRFEMRENASKVQTANERVGLLV
jgi:hypothetical protein